MLSRVAVLVGLVACHGDPPADRARVLDQIPGTASSVLAADGKVLSQPRIRPLVDALRPEVPAGLDCALDAALQSEQVAVGIEPSGDVTIAIATRAHVQCAALSQVASGLWIGTLGGGAPAAAGAGVTRAPAFARALPYLRDAPIALVTQQAGMHVLATAAPDPLAAWVAIDAPTKTTADELAKQLRAALDDAAKTDALAQIVKRIDVKQTGAQVVATLGAGPGDLAVALRAAIERTRAAIAQRAFPCPSPFAPPVLACSARECTTPLSCAVEENRISLSSLAPAIEALLAARKDAVVVNGRVEGVRLRDDLATYGLRSGDVLIAVDGKRLTSVDQIPPYLAGTKGKASLIVARLRRFATIELQE